MAAEKWINDNMSLIDKPQYGNAALLLMPVGTNGTYNANVYNEQVAQGIRAKLAPFEDTGNGEFPSYLDQLYINAGNAIVLGQWYPQYEKQLAATPPHSAERYQIETNWQTTLDNYAARNPVWGNYFQPGASIDSKELQRGQLINQMKALLSGPDAPDTQVARDTRILLQKYDAVNQQITTATTDGFTGELSPSAIYDQWKDDLYATLAAHPAMANVITGLFLSAPETITVPASAPGETGEPGVFTARSWNAA